MVGVIEITNVFDPINSQRSTFKEAGKPLSEYLPVYYKELLVSYDGKITTDYSLKVEDGTQIILAPILEGGGGSKNILRMVAFIALAVVAGPIAGFINETLLSSAFAAESLGMYALQAGVMAAGGLLINAVLPPQMADMDYTGGEKESPTYGWSSAKTLPRPGAPIPILYGQMRVAGNVINQYIKDLGNDQYLYSQLALCEGEIEPISTDDILINNNPIDNYEEVAYSFRQGTESQILDPSVATMKNLELYSTAHMKWFDKISTAAVFSSEVSYGTPVEKTTSGNAVEGIELEIVLPQGLFYVNDKGHLTNKTVQFKIEYKKHSDVDWTIYQRYVAEYYVTEYEWYYVDDWTWEKTYTWSTSSPGSSWAKTGRSRQIRQGDQYYDYWYITAAQRSPIRKQYLIAELEADQYDIRVTKLSANATDTRSSNTLYWNGFNELNYKKLYYPFLALLGLKIKATGQLSGGAPQISTLIRRKSIDVYDENGTFVKTVRSNNPAWVAWDLLTNKRYGAGKDYNRVDYAAFSAFADWCDEKVPSGKGYDERRADFNGLIDFQSNIWDVLQKVCSVGHGAPIIYGTKYSVVVDKPTTPTQLFSMGNIIKGSYKTAYTGVQDLSNEIEVSYLDKDANYTKQVVSVILGEGGKKTTIQSLGTTSQTQAIRLGRYLLQCNDKQRRIVEFDANIDAIACKIGDVIYFAHDVPKWGDSGRIVDITSTSVTIDRQVYCESAKTYKVTVRVSDDSIQTATLDHVASDGDYETFTFSAFSLGTIINGGNASSTYGPTYGGGDSATSSFTQTFTCGDASSSYASPLVYDVYTFGEENKEYLKLRVTSISRKNDHTRHFVCLDYNESILTDTTEPTLIDRPSSLTGFASITNLEATEHLEKKADGTIVPFIDLTWEVEDSRFTLVDIMLSKDDGNSWVPLVQNLKTKFYTFNALELAEGETYKIAVCATDFTGTQPIADATQISHTYLGKSEPPADITGLTYTIFAANGVRLAWDEGTDVDLFGYNVYKNGSLFRENVTTSALGVGFANDGDVFGVKAVDTSGNESTNLATVTISYSSADAPVITGTIEGETLHLEWSKPTSTWDIDYYVLTYGSTTITVDTRAWDIPVTWETMDFSVYGVDKAGASTGTGYYTNTIILPEMATLTYEVIDNNIILRWSYTEGSLPVTNNTVRKGDTFETASEIGLKKGTFTVVFESTGGDYTYWVAPIDSAGNIGTAKNVSLTLSDPPNYILNKEWSSDFDGTHNNTYNSTSTHRLIAPINTTTSYQNHFDNNSWSSPQDQIDAGFALWSQPWENTGTYEETFDYGVLLGSSMVTIDKTIVDQVGIVDMTADIALSDDNSNWTTYTDTWTVYGTDFRYVKITLHFTGENQKELVALNPVIIRLDAKEQYDSGRSNVYAADSGGTTITFNKSFVDVVSIIVTPEGTSQRTAVYDFTDAPNPTDFSVYLFDDTGTRVDGTVSWAVTGF